MPRSAAHPSQGRAIHVLLQRSLPRALPIVAGAILLYNAFPLLQGGFYRAGDNAQHILAELVLADAIRAGDNPLGPLGLEFGLPLLRFYQPLTYLWNVAWHLVAGVDLAHVHALTMSIGFALTPLANYYCFAKLGLPRISAALGALFGIASIAGFGNSFEAYFGVGIATQAVAAEFFPLFVGTFAGMRRGENRPSTVGLTMALAVLAHATMAVYAMLFVLLHLLTVRGTRPAPARALLAVAGVFLALSADRKSTRLNSSHYS